MSKPAKARIDLISGPVGATLVRLTVPMIFALLALIGFSIADTYFVGLLGTQALAALGFTLPVTTLVTYIGIGLGIGTSALVARAIGAGKHEDAARITTDSIALAILIAAIVLTVAISTIDPLFAVLGAPDELLGLIREYMMIWLLGTGFMLPQMVSNSALRAIGDTATASRMMLIAACLNGVLDPLMIFGFGPIPGLGFKGAACATILAWGIVFCIALPILFRRERLIDLRWPGAGHLLQAWRQHLTISAPAAAANMMTPIGTGIITATVAAYGAEAVAAYGVIGRFEGLAMLIVLAMSTSLPPFLSQNLGAALHERVRQAVKSALVFVVVLELVVFVLLYFSAPFIAQIFSEDMKVASVIVTILMILPASYSCQALVVLSNSSFNALHEPRKAVMLSIARWFVFYIPMALVGEYWFGLEGLFVGAACGNVLVGVLAAVWITRYTARLCRSQPEASAEAVS